MVGPNTAKAIALVSGSGGTGRTTTARTLAQTLGKKNRVLLFDLCFGWGGMSYDSVDLPSYEKLLNFENDELLAIPTEGGFDVLTCEPPEFLDPTLEDLKKIAWISNEYAEDYDYIIFDPPSGGHPLALLSSGMSEQVLLFTRPEASSVASSYCLLKSLFAEGIYNRIRIVFAGVDSAEQAASLKTRFDIMTEQFLGLKIADGGFIYRREINDDEFETNDLNERTLESINNLNFGAKAALQNETGLRQSGIVFPDKQQVRR
jgi:MinD-like ATPase involved in chromosome partitioning or flagellar assembly